MRKEKQNNRKMVIEQAALELLAERGFQGTSMLKVAKRACSSNETLYRWSGSKAGLLSALIERHRNRIERRVQEEALTEKDPLEALSRAGVAVETLRIESVVLYRAVLVEQGSRDSDGTLGRQIRKLPNECLKPLQQSKVFGALGSNLMIKTFMSQLIGDLLLRSLLGEEMDLSRSQCIRQSNDALQKARQVLA